MNTPESPEEASPTPPNLPAEPLRAEVLGPLALPPRARDDESEDEPEEDDEDDPGAPYAPTRLVVSPSWLALAGGVCVFVSICLTLAVLALANGGLTFATHGDLTTLKTGVDALKAQVDRQETDLGGLRARVEAAEKVAGRTVAVEQAAGALQTELDQRSSDVEGLRAAVADMQKKIEQMAGQNSAFETFVAGLRSLLNQLPAQGTH